MIALALCLLVLLIGILLYNSLVRKRNRVDNASASVDAMLEKRFDLIPNLVACVRQYAAHEADTLSDVIERRSARTGALSDDEKASLDAAFGKARLNFLALGENYPELKASENFMHLQYTLNETEEQNTTTPCRPSPARCWPRGSASRPAPCSRLPKNGDGRPTWADFSAATITLRIRPPDSPARWKTISNPSAAHSPTPSTKSKAKGSN